MILSMTAFTRNQHQDQLGTFIIEIRSINHRFLEMGVNLPDVMRVLEMQIRDRIKKQLNRGKIEFIMRFQPNIAHDNFKINTQIAQELCRASEKIATMLKDPEEISATDILRFPGVLQMQETDISQVQQVVLTLVDKSIKDLISVRAREGEELEKLFFQRLSALSDELEKIRKRAPHMVTEQDARLKRKFAEAKLEIDSSRLEQEMVFFMQKIDIAEEIDRLATHLQEANRIIKEGGVVGRRLDFLLQELNREANTIGSKSIDSEITHAAVEMKVLIEQIREQVQNIE